jgi:hypothetical protein
MVSGGCHRDEPSPEITSAPLATTAPAPPARDHLVPGELLEGNVQVFGLALPRGSRIESAFPEQAIAACDARATDVANYIRPRVSMGTVSVGAASTNFDRVHVPSNPQRDLVIRVEQAPTGLGSRIIVRDVTPPPADPSLTEEQRWKQVGMTPGGGRIADPTHLH